jgi:CNT family concentrative nucleoside transporter
LPSIAIQIGGLSAMAPERRGDLARLAPRAMIAGALACWMTGAIAGVFVI